MTSTQNEINKQSRSNILGKRKKVREKRADFLQNWIEKSTQHTLGAIPDADIFDMYPSHVPASYFPAHTLYGPRLFATTSDPSVCRYSNPFTFPNEPLSLPVYTSPYLPVPPYSNSVEYGAQNNARHLKQNNNKNMKYQNRQRKNRTNRKTTCLGIENEFSKMHNGISSTSNSQDVRSGTSSAIGINNDFTSLPPVVDLIKENNLSVDSVEDDKSGNQRRFSDPGIAQNPAFEAPLEESGDETDSESSSIFYADHPNNRLIMCLVDHINSLKECNIKLHKELRETKGELESLKQQFPLWRGDSASSVGQPGLNALGQQSTGAAGSSAMYAPGMLADIVREIRDAARMREEALYNKVRSMIDEKTYNKANCNVSQDKNFSDWRNVDQFRNQLQASKARTNDRLDKLEDELHSLRISQRDSHSPLSFSGVGLGGAGSPPSVIDQERHRLRMELNKERDAHAAADARVHKLELMVTQMRSKRGGSGSGGYTSASTPVHANGGTTPDPRHMVLGPITDL